MENNLQEKSILLKEVKDKILENLSIATKTFVIIGYYLKQARDQKLYTADGCEDIWEFALKNFMLGKSSASRFMNINDKFSVNGNSPELIDEYKGFEKSQLSEMLTLSDEQLEKVSPSMTVTEIRSMKPKKNTVAISQQEVDVEKSQYDKLCKHDGKSNCVAVCFPEIECCGECPESGHCNTECGWVDERAPKPDINPYDEKKPDPGTFIYCVSGDGKVDKYEVISRHSDFSPKYFNVKDKFGVVYDVSAESEHWHYTGDDVKKDPWYREKKPNKSQVVDDTPVAADETNEIMDNQAEIVNDVDETVIPEKKCPYCKYIIMTPEEYFKDHPDAKEFPCNNCDDTLNHWEEEPEQVETVEADIIQTVPTKAYDFNKISQYGLTDVKLAIMDHQKNLAAYKDCELDAPIVQREKMEMDALQALEESLYMHDMPVQEPVRVEQPELPALKNNDQRKEFIEAYATWPIWIDLKQTGERYYRYDFDNGDAFIIKVFKTDRKHYDWKTGKAIEVQGLRYEYQEEYILKPDKQFKDCANCVSGMIEYLKNYQKKRA